MLRYLSPLAAALLIAFLPGSTLGEIPKDKIKIGVLQDMPGPYADRTGRGAVVAAELAAGDFETQRMKGDAEILAGKFHTDAAAEIGEVKDWLEKEDVAAVLSSASPDLNRRIAALVRAHHRTLLIAGSAEDRTAQPCGPNIVLWGAGSEARASALARVLVPEKGKTWFLVGEQTPAATSTAAALKRSLQAAGGQLLGETDIVPGSSDLNQEAVKIAQAGPQIVALSVAGGELVDALRAFQGAGLANRATIASPFASLEDVDQAGATVAEGLVVVAPFYWDSNDQTRDFAKRWHENQPSAHVSANAAYDYAAALSFIHAARAVDDIDSDRVLGELRRAPPQHSLFGKVTIDQNGAVAYDLTVYRVKSPGDIRERWDYLSKVQTIPAAQAFSGDECSRK